MISIRTGLFCIIVLTPILLSAGNHSPEADCLACHGEEFSQPVGHFIESNTDCMFCHDPSPDGNSVYTAEDDEICEVCHVAQSSAVEAGTHSAMACRACHDPHASPNPHRFKASETELCAGHCHGEHDLGESHPVGTGVTDPRVDREMSCVSTCHSMHHPKEEKLLQMAALDLCHECHGDKF